MDVAVVRRAQQGDQEAFGAIVNHSIDRLYAIASLMTRDRALAEDAVQDAFLRAWRDLPRLRDVDRVSQWLTKLTVNATYDLLRKRRRLRHTVELEEGSLVVPDRAAHTIDGAALEAAYGALAPEQRAVVVLHYYLGFSLDEAALTLGIPPGTARSRLHAGLKTMRALLGTDTGDGAVRPVGAKS